MSFVNIKFIANDEKKKNNSNVFLSSWIWFFLLINMTIKIDEINNIDKLIAKLPNRIDIGKSKNKYNKKLLLFTIFFNTSILIIQKIIYIWYFLILIELLIFIYKSDKHTLILSKLIHSFK